MDAAVSPPRLCSLDAFRGYTVAAMILVNNPGSWSHIYPPLQHADWHGWTPTDLVFPFFLFIAGVAIPLAFAAQRARGAGDATLATKAIRRGVVLVALGLVLASPSKKGWGPLAAGFAATLAAAWVLGRSRWPAGRPARELCLTAVWLLFAGWLIGFGEPIRIPGVLQRIGVCYAVGALLYLRTTARARAWLVGILLLAYWAVLMWVPVPGAAAGLIDSKTDNLASYLDRLLLEGHIWIAGERDPEGPLSTLGALATILLGISAGELLRTPSDEARPQDLTLRLMLRGAVLVVAGYAWGWLLPINKPLWTSSYAVLTAGQATCALGLCHWAFDVRGHRRWAAPGVTFGLNAITVFVGSGLLARLMAARGADGVSTKSHVYDALKGLGLSEVDASLAYALLWIAGWWIVLRVLQARRIVVKV